MSGPRLEGQLEDQPEGVPGEVVADSGWSTCAETGLCCEEQKLKAGDSSCSDAESDGEASHLPKPWLAPRAKAGGLHQCSQAWHSWSRGRDTSVAGSLGQCQTGAGTGPEEGKREPTGSLQGQAEWFGCYLEAVDICKWDSILGREQISKPDSGGWREL